MQKGYLVLETGKVYEGDWLGGAQQFGEVVFNTSHSGYEEMCTDPSYYSQIIVSTASMQGNYGVSKDVWESENLWVKGFVCLEMQKSKANNGWLNLLTSFNIPVIHGLDTRDLVLYLRNQGTCWGGMIKADSSEEALEIFRQKFSQIKEQDLDWAFQVSTKNAYLVKGKVLSGPKVAVIDFGCKKNILNELVNRCSEVKVFPSRSTPSEILNWNPDGILLSNGPGDPANVNIAVDTVKTLLEKKFIFGICMGHQILSLALGAKTYKLKYGHRGSNHPVLDKIQNKIYVTSQNHGYAVDEKSLDNSNLVSHINLNDKTVSGICDLNRKFLSVQFHPESHPGPHDSEVIFDMFVKQMM